MKFIENIEIRYINLDSREDRNIEIINHFKDLGISRYKKISALSPKNIERSILDAGNSLGCKDNEVACTFSNLLSIQDFLNNSNDEYGIFCEDDADLTNLKKINFSPKELFLFLHKDVGCVQLGVSTREDLNINFFIHERSPWDFNTSTYILKRNYAKTLIEKYLNNNKLTFNNFNKKFFIEYRNNTVVNSTPVAEFIVYDEKTYTIPLTTYKISQSSIQETDEVLRQNIKSREDFYSYWSNFDTIELQDLIDQNDNFFSSEYLNKNIISKNIKVVIPWRENSSRVEIFNKLISFYKDSFSHYEIILSDSGSDIFNLSASRNKGILEAISKGADIVIVTDADFFPSTNSLIASLHNANNTNNITIPYTRYNEISDIGTQQFLDKNPNSILMSKKSNIAPKLIDGKTDRFWVCSGAFIITKEKFLEFGGFDENFIGWGPEDQDYHKRYFDKYEKLFDYINGIGCSLEHSRKEWQNENITNPNIQYFINKHGNTYIL